MNDLHATPSKALDEGRLQPVDKGGVTLDEVEAAINLFNGGIMRKDDPQNKRGYTDLYFPRQAMKAVLENFARHRHQSETGAALPSDGREAVARTLTDPQRLLWRDDVEGICPSPDMCFEYGDHARCGPCAIKQATALGVESDLSLPNLPEVYRLRRELAALAQPVEAGEDGNG